MIISFILFFFGIIIQIIAGILGAVTWLLPHQVTDAVTWLFAQFHIFDFLIPMDDFMAALGAYLTFLGFWYSIKLIMHAYHVVRHGGSVATPKVKDKRA